MGLRRLAQPINSMRAPTEIYKGGRQYLLVETSSHSKTIRRGLLQIAF
jgi:hypothetical protein